MLGQLVHRADLERLHLIVPGDGVRRGWHGACHHVGWLNWPEDLTSDYRGPGPWPVDRPDRWMVNPTTAEWYLARWPRDVEEPGAPVCRFCVKWWRWYIGDMDEAMARLGAYDL